MPSLKLGFVGLGIMGAPMASNLVRAGFNLSVYNRTPSRCDPLADLGATVVRSLAELGASSDVVIAMVSDTPDVEAILFQPAGLASAMKPGSIFIDMSSIAPSATARFAHLLSERSIAMLDAPVSGGEAGAKAGTLSIMAGGPPETFERCRPILQAIGSSILHMGPSGSGQVAKLINQTVTSLNLLAAVEAVRLAQAAGLDVNDTLRVIGGGAGGSWMISHLGPKIAAGDFAPGFRIRLQDKDLRNAAEFASQLGIEAPGLALASLLFRQAIARGLGELGNHGLYRLWTSRPPAGLPLPALATHKQGVRMPMHIEIRS
jgi:3-hydroxyisobutyrate dehydrogenase